MPKTIKLNVRIKPHCNCTDHYLELMQAFDGHTYTYRRCCTKCGKWWTDTLSDHITEYGGELQYYDTFNRHVLTVKKPQVIQTEHTVIFDDGHGHRGIYLKYSDGTLSELLRTETY